MTAPRLFTLVRDVDVSGVSGTGVVAEGIAFSSGVVVLHWLGEWSSVVTHERGMASVEHIHGHGGATRIVWADAPVPPPTVDGYPVHYCAGCAEGPQYTETDEFWCPSCERVTTGRFA